MLGVRLVIGGGPRTIPIIADAVNDRIPVIIFKDTSQAALLISYAYDLVSLEDCNLLQLEEHQNLLELIETVYADLTLEKRLECYHQIMRCTKFKKYVCFLFYINICNCDCEMSSSIINAMQVCQGCADRQRPPVNSFGKSSSAHSRGWYVPQSRAIMHNANDSLLCCNVKLFVSVKFQSYVEKYISVTKEGVFGSQK